MKQSSLITFLLLFFLAAIVLNYFIQPPSLWDIIVAETTIENFGKNPKITKIILIVMILALCFYIAGIGVLIFKRILNKRFKQ